MYKFSFYFCAAALFSSTALADGSLNCNSHPDCEAMGYSKTGWEDCDRTLSCLYDPSYKVCATQCNDGGDGVCSDGKILSSECAAQGGIGLVNTTESSEIVNDPCVKCQKCNDIGYTMVSTGNISDSDECQDEIYYSWNGNISHKCCIDEDACPSGYILKELCSGDQDLISNEIKYKGNTCVTCDKCSTQWWKKGENGYTGETTPPSGYKCTFYRAYYPDAMACCEPCSTCVGGTYITSADQITTPGTYCVGGNINITRSTTEMMNGHYIFQPSGCGSFLTIATQIKSVVSNVYTTINNGAAVESLTLTAGGKFNVPMNCGSYTGSGTTGKNCQVTLYGSTDKYDFSASKQNDTARNLPTLVSCSQGVGDSGNKSQLIFGTNAPSSSGYLFTGTAKNGSLTLGTADDTCKGVVCERTGSNGTIKNGNVCE